MLFSFSLDLFASAKWTRILFTDAPKDDRHVHEPAGSGPPGYGHSGDSSLHHRIPARHGAVSHEGTSIFLPSSKSEIDSGRIGYLTMGGTFPFTADGCNPMKGKAKKEDVDVSQFSFSFTTLMRVLAAPRSEA